MKEKKIVVGFWLRLLADILDAIFLAIFCYFVIIRSFWQIVYILGDAGIFIGLCFSLFWHSPEFNRKRSELSQKNIEDPSSKDGRKLYALACFFPKICGYRMYLLWS